MYKVVGTCSNCGGRVVIPHVWMGIFPPVPTCLSCGSTAKGSKEKIIPMNPKPKYEKYCTNTRYSKSDKSFDKTTSALEIIDDIIKNMRKMGM